jgi:hypothetical protein
MLRESALLEGRSSQRRGAAADQSSEQEQFLRDLPEKFRELHWTLWLAEAELDGPKPEVSVEYLKLLAEEIDDAISHFH